MILSRRSQERPKDGVRILVQAAEEKPSSNAPATPRAHDGSLDGLDNWRKRTDTDGTERRARQTKQDNELL